ncbi:DUF4249 domain-containing protein [Flavobacterium sp. DG1-102-2]|uniref:DUF4249 domain-containing protein n=1 Tax=Flavobacterium sp. DG1-102-2 TaxID=3081663 RepID=UPI0029497363|nr:DUF4249 domain-containing protein [Flavobacterium sp. DG1-102-2]MDV6168646.1 DUF4249 domain-containing protein [Flavobacterium sp. DG1-102-2]
MKNIRYIILIMAAVFFTACEEVVDVDLDTSNPRLVIDASINWIKGTAGNEQTIRLTTTGSYYENTVPVVSGATVFVTNSANTVFNFIETPGTGQYLCTNFEPVIGETYTLTVQHDGETFTAAETLYPTPDVENITQQNDGGFTGDEIEVKYYYKDNGDEDNFYLVRIDTDIYPFPRYGARSDEFQQGNLQSVSISDEDLEAGKLLNFKLYGISERYYNYMSIIISMVEGGAGSGPFQTPPVNARGNIVNQTNEGNFALGYFRLGEVTAVEYTIQ